MSLTIHVSHAKYEASCSLAQRQVKRRFRVKLGGGCMEGLKGLVGAWPSGPFPCSGAPSPILFSSIPATWLFFW